MTRGFPRCPDKQNWDNEYEVQHWGITSKNMNLEALISLQKFDVKVWDTGPTVDYPVSEYWQQSILVSPSFVCILKYECPATAK